LNKKILFIWGAIFILASGIIYTIQEILDWYTLTKQIGVGKDMIWYTHDYKVIITFLVIGVIIWLLSVFYKEK